MPHDAVMEIVRRIELASDAQILAGIGLFCLLIAAIATLAERRRAKRVRLDRVGCVPWTAIFLLFFLAGVVMLALSLPALLAGQG